MIALALFCVQPPLVCDIIENQRTSVQPAFVCDIMMLLLLSTDWNWLYQQDTATFNGFLTNNIQIESYGHFLFASWSIMLNYAGLLLGP